MTQKELVKFFRENAQKIVAAGVLFALAGVVSFYVVPVKYLATGTLFVSRETVSPELVLPSEFTYEGYYAQQNAANFTATLIGLVESEDVQSAVLTKLNKEVTAKSLFSFKRRVQVKKQAPQLVSVQVKGDTRESAASVWKVLVGEVSSVSQQVTSQDDNQISLILVSEEPVVREQYRNIMINAVIGFGLGLSLSTFFFFLKE